MRILFATRDYPPTGMGGTEVYTATLANGMRLAHNDVSVFCVGEWDIGTQSFNGSTVDECEGIPVTRVNLNWLKAVDPTRYLYDNPEVACFFERHLLAVDPDIVHVTSCDRISASIVAAAKRAGYPVVLSLTDFWFLCPRVSLLRSDGSLCDGKTSAWTCLRCVLHGTKFLKAATMALPTSLVKPVVTRISRTAAMTRRRGFRGLATDMADRKRRLQELLHCVDYVMIASEFGRELVRSVLPEREIHLVTYGHDLEWLARYQGKTDSLALRFAYIGRLDETKGVHVLIDAFRQLPLHFPATLSIYGRMAQSDYGLRLQHLAMNDARIRFCGGYLHEESDRIYASVDVLVIPSLWYDFPLVAHEALATGTVVVASDVPGLTEIVVPEVTGLLFQRGSVSDLVDKLRRLIYSPETVSGLRENSVPMKGVEEAVGELLGVYYEILGAVPTGGFSRGLTQLGS